MTVTHNVSQEVGSNGATSLSVSIVLPNSPNRYLMGHALESASTIIDLTSIVWNTTETLTEVWDVAQGSFLRGWAYGLINPTAVTANLTLTFASSKACAIIGSSFIDVNQSTPTGTVVTAVSSTGTTHSVTNNNGVTGGLIIGGVLRSTVAADRPRLTDNGGQTSLQITDDNSIDDFSCIGVSSEVFSGSVVMGWTSTEGTTDAWIAGATPLVPTGAGGAVYRRPDYSYFPKPLLRTD
jgi:hypothetical protein